MGTEAPERTIYDVQRDLDLDDMLDAAVPPPSCEWCVDVHTHELCGSPATWIMSLTCGHSAYFDDEHVDEMKKIIAKPGKNACDNPSAPRHRRMMIVEARFDRIAS